MARPGLSKFQSVPPGVLNDSDDEVELPPMFGRGVTAPPRIGQDYAPGKGPVLESDSDDDAAGPPQLPPSLLRVGSPAQFHAATKAQALVRGHLARKRVKNLRQKRMVGQQLRPAVEANKPYNSTQSQEVAKAEHTRAARPVQDVNVTEQRVSETDQQKHRSAADVLDEFPVTSASTSAANGKNNAGGKPKSSFFSCGDRNCSGGCSIM